MDVTLAEDGQIALDILKDTRDFDGILMDCQMPVMDGYTATREIRKDPDFQSIPIIAMTANAMVGDREKVIEAGMVDHIAKPLNVTAMFNTIASWIVPANPIEFNPAETKDDLASTLPDLPGIDVQVGMATTMQNLKLYTKLLTKFRDSQANFVEQFAAAKSDDDPKAATRCAHTLKGTAGNIGAKQVQEAAQHLELACNEDKPAAEIDDLLQKTLSELAPVIAGLQHISTLETTAPFPAREVDQAEVQELLSKLKEMLEDSDAEATDVLDELFPMVQGSAMAPHLKQAANAIEEYDFDAALERLKSIDSKS